MGRSGLDVRGALGWARDGLPGRWSVAALYAVPLVVGVALHLWLASGDGLWWQDSADYTEVAENGLFSLDLWAGSRPPAVPLMLKLVGRNPERYLVVQALVAAVCWAVLASTLSRTVRGWRRWATVALVLAFSATVPVAMWERSVLSEAVSLAALALVAAAAVELVRAPSWPRAGWLLAACVWWLAIRDSVAGLLLLAGLFLLVVLGLRALARKRAPQALWLTVGFVFVLLGQAGMVAASHGGRDETPVRNLYAARVLPYPDRVAWFAAHGMPQADQFAGPTARDPARAPRSAPVMPIGEDDPGLGRFNAWLASHGRSTFLRWMLTHPDYVLTEPFRHPERAFNNFEGDRRMYAAVDANEVPWISGVLVPEQVVALVVAAGAGVYAFRRDGWRSPALLVGLGAIGLSAPHALLAWHADAMETARHLVLAVVQFHLGVLLVGVAALQRIGSALPPPNGTGISVPAPDTPVEVGSGRNPAQEGSSSWPDTADVGGSPRTGRRSSR